MPLLLLVAVTLQLLAMASLSWHDPMGLSCLFSSAKQLVVEIHMSSNDCVGAMSFSATPTLCDELVYGLISPERVDDAARECGWIPS